MKNFQSDPPIFINTAVYDCVKSFMQTLPKNAALEAFETLMESLLFALRNCENPIKLSKRIRRERYHKPISLNPLSPIQAMGDIVEIKRLRKLAKAKPLIPGSRKLDPYRQEIDCLHKSGASHNDIKYWLHANKNVIISQPTIHRYLKAISDAKKI